MVFRPVAIAVGLFLMLEVLELKAMAFKTSNINDYGIEHRRIHKTRNDRLQKARDENERFSYKVDSPRNSEGGRFYIIDYENVIEDGFLRDKPAAEPKTSKRSDNVEHVNQAIPKTPCQCQSKIESIKLGDNTFPTHIDSRICDKERETECVFPFICRETYYEIPILRRKTLANANLSLEEIIPNNLRFSWISEYKSISIGCQCLTEYEFTI